VDTLHKGDNDDYDDDDDDGGDDDGDDDNGFILRIIARNFLILCGQ
jgi:hypothetical protein